MKDNNITAADEVSCIDQDLQCANEPVIEPLKGSKERHEIVDIINDTLSVVDWEGISVRIEMTNGTEISIFRRRTYDD